MAAHVLRLRIALLAGAFRADTATVVRRAIGVVVLAAAVVAGCIGLLAVGRTSSDALLVVTVLGGSALTLGFLVAPLLLAVDDPLDPRRFALLGLAPGRLAAVTAASSLVSVPILAVAVLATAAAIAWARQGVPWWVGAASVVLVVVTSGLLARLGMGLRALVLRHRGVERLTGVVVVLVLVAVVPAVVFVVTRDARLRMPTPLVEAARVLALTPLGAAWGLPDAAHAGATRGWITAGAALATAALLAGAWMLLAARLLTTPERPVRRRERAGLGWFGVVPRTTAGAIAARSILYWLSDRRYLVNLAVVPVAAVVAAVPLLVAGVPLAVAVLVPAPIAALLFGWLPHDDLAYDSTAVWMHIAGGVRGLADRVGRLAPILLVAVPTLAVAIPLTVAVHGRWAVLAAMIGVCASLFLAALGLASISSVVAPYAVTRPGDSPFQQPERTGSTGAFGQAAVLLGAIVVSVPTLWFGWLAVTGIAGASTTALWVGLVTGSVVLVVGIGVGSAVFDRSGGRLMEFAEAT